MQYLALQRVQICGNLQEEVQQVEESCRVVEEVLPSAWSGGGGLPSAGSGGGGLPSAGSGGGGLPSAGSGGGGLPGAVSGGELAGADDSSWGGGESSPSCISVRFDSVHSRCRKIFKIGIK